MAEIRLGLDEADGDLPEVCMCCGEPATLIRTKRMRWFPPWVNLLILLGLLPYAIGFHTHETSPRDGALL